MESEQIQNQNYEESKQENERLTSDFYQENHEYFQIKQTNPSHSHLLLHKSVEPYFQISNFNNHFRIECTTLDFDDDNQKPILLNSKILCIKKQGCVIYEKESDQNELDDEFQEQIMCYGIFGILQLDTELFLVAVTEVKLVAKCPNGNKIYQIIDTDFIPFCNYIDMQSKSQSQKRFHSMSSEIEKYVFGIKKIIQNQGFYFSYYYDLSRAQQKQILDDTIIRNDDGFWGQGSQQDILFWRRKQFVDKNDIFCNVKQDQPQIYKNHQFDCRYVQNWGLLQDFELQNIDPFWTILSIQGYIHFQEENILINETGLDQDLEIVLISRRRVAQGGARFFCRGMDEEGNCGNFVETELIVSNQQYTFSFIQVRGSIPLFWEQKQHGLITEINILRSIQSSKNAFLKHQMDLLSEYKKVLIVNLIRKKKPEEDSLSKSLYKMINLIKKKENSNNSNNEQVQQNNQNLKIEQKCEAVRKFLKHIWFDFHEETHGDNFNKVNSLIDEIKSIQIHFGFFIRSRFIQQNKIEIYKIQKGIFRSNCIDCLDRTNFTQMCISIRAFQQFIDIIKSQANQNSPPKKEISSLKKTRKICATEKCQLHYLIQEIKKIWAENGDLISVQYTGAESNISRVTIQNTKGIIGKLEQWQVGINRYYQYLMNDQFKQECIQLLTCSQKRAQRESQYLGLQNTNNVQGYLCNQDLNYGMQRVLDQALKYIANDSEFVQISCNNILILALDFNDLEFVDESELTKIIQIKIQKIWIDFQKIENFNEIKIIYIGIYRCSFKSSQSFCDKLISYIYKQSSQKYDQSLNSFQKQQNSLSNQFLYMQEDINIQKPNFTQKQQYQEISFSLNNFKSIIKFQQHVINQKSKKMNIQQRQQTNIQEISFNIIFQDSIAIELEGQDVQKCIANQQHQRLQIHDGLIKYFGQFYEEQPILFKPQLDHQKQYMWKNRILYGNYTGTPKKTDVIIQPKCYFDFYDHNQGVASVFQIQIKKFDQNQKQILKYSLAKQIIKSKINQEWHPSEEKIKQICESWKLHNYNHQQNDLIRKQSSLQLTQIESSKNENQTWL